MLMTQHWLNHLGATFNLSRVVTLVLHDTLVRAAGVKSYRLVQMISINYGVLIKDLDFRLHFRTILLEQITDEEVFAGCCL